MIEKEVIIKNKIGMHMRPASMLVQAASKYESDFYIIQEDGFEVNGKSILSLIGLEAAKGTKLKFRAEGQDEEEMMKELVEIVDAKFNEE